MIDSNFVKNLAKENGFDLCGIAKVRELKELEEFYKQWLSKNYHAEQEYLKRHFEKRLNPELVYYKAQSIIVVAKHYLPNQFQQDKNCKISKYAHGGDYHIFMKDALRRILSQLKKSDRSTKAKILVDSGTAFEKYWAMEAGIGGITKNTLVTSKEYGSYIFLGLLLINKELEPEQKFSEDMCGDCNLCIKACPNGAINKNRTLNCNKCIAYQTIESSERDPNLKYSNWIYGCDICQDVCPLNKNIKSTEEKFFSTKKEIISYSKNNWQNIDVQKFNEIFKDSAIHRIGLKRFKSNIE
jgi:epoxyqueuosine reductase